MKTPTKAAEAFMQSVIDDAGRNTYSDALPLALLEKLAVKGRCSKFIHVDELDTFPAKNLSPAD